MQERLHMKFHPGLNPPPFSAQVVEVNENNIMLSESYCFPRGGGQPGDIGVFIGSNFQSNFMEVLPGDLIQHPVTNSDLFVVDDFVSCVIDRISRNKNTKLHTTQHIVSALANDIFEAETVGNQISQDHTRLDLLFPDRDKFNPDELETSFNEIIKTNAAVNIYQWDREKITSHENMRHTNFLDRIPTSVKKLRVVEIEGIDLCPCGGTHVNNIGLLDNLKIKNVKSKGAGKLRITY
tara:strand:+ start:72 stop:782 length:711 start_codon:yes stop_codon:yes gene_type:complete